MASLDPAVSAIYTDSLQRCLDQERFLWRFYELFLASSPEVRQKFAQTDFKRQIRALKKSLLEASWIGIPTQEARAELEKVAQAHSRAKRDVPAHLYDLWLESLLQSMRDTDPQCSPAVEEAWRTVLGQVIAFMKSRY